MDETNETICRFCLSVGNDFSPLNVLSEEKLYVVIPELHLAPSAAFVICRKCRSSVEEFYKLKSRFRLTVLNNDHVCFICSMSIGRDKKEIKKDTGDYLFSSVLEMCLPEVGQDYIEKVAMCEFCYDTLRNLYFFKHKCLSVNKKIDLYYKFETHKEVALCEVLQFMSEDSTNVMSISDFEVADENDGESSNEENGANNGQNVSGSQNHEETRGADNDELHGTDDEEPHGEDDGDKVLNDSGEPLSKKKKDPNRLLEDGLPRYHFYLPHIIEPRRGVTMEEWLVQVEQLKQENKWSVELAKTKILKRMKTLKPDMNEWFVNVTKNTNWKEFKKILISAFPGTKDFAANIRHVLNLQRVEKVSYTNFFHKKMILLKQIDITDNEAISLILNGVANARVNSAARVGNYKTPGELLQYFKQCNVQYPVYNFRDASKSKKSKKKKLCTKCFKKGHLATNCKTEKFLEREKKLKEENPRYIGRGRMKKRDACCYLCGAYDHKSKKCPRKNYAKLETLYRDMNKEPELKTEVMCSRCNEKGHVYRFCPRVLTKAQKKLKREEAQKEKLAQNAKPPLERHCPYCNQVGHFMSDCPLNPYSTPEDSFPSYASEIMWKKVVDERRSPAQQECQRCKKVGHLKSDCPMTALSKAAPRSSDLRCSLCNGVGHKSLNCPQIMPTKRSTETSTRAKVDSDGRSSRSVEVTKQLEQTCNLCNTIGHSEHNCPERWAQLYLNRSSECTFCQSERHISSNCPLLKTPQKSTTFNQFNDPDQNSEEYAQYRSTESRSSRHSDRYKSNGAAIDRDTVNHFHVTSQDRPEPLSNVYNIFGPSSTEMQEPSRFRQCVRCGKGGHSSGECPQYIWAQQNTSQCIKCGKFGHQPSDCPLFKRPTETRFSSVLSRLSSTSAGLSSHHPENYSSRYRN